MAEITVNLDEKLASELAAMAKDAEKSEDELVREGIKLLIQAHRGLALPRYARRVGPLAVAEDPTLSSTNE